MGFEAYEKMMITGHPSGIVSLHVSNESPTADGDEGFQLVGTPEEWEAFLIGRSRAMIDAIRSVLRFKDTWYILNTEDLSIMSRALVSDDRKMEFAAEMWKIKVPYDLCRELLRMIESAADEARREREGDSSDCIGPGVFRRAYRAHEIPVSQEQRDAWARGDFVVATQA